MRLMTPQQKKKKNPCRCFFVPDPPPPRRRMYVKPYASRRVRCSVPQAGNIFFFFLPIPAVGPPASRVWGECTSYKVYIYFDTVSMYLSRIRALFLKRRKGLHTYNARTYAKKKSPQCHKGSSMPVYRKDFLSSEYCGYLCRPGEAEDIDIYTPPPTPRPRSPVSATQQTYNSSKYSSGDRHETWLLAMLKVCPSSSTAIRPDVTCLQATPGSGPHCDPPAYIHLEQCWIDTVQNIP